MFFRLLDLTIYNAYVMRKSLHGMKPFLDFKMNLIRQLIDSTGGVKPKPPHPTLSARIRDGVEIPERLTARHFPGKGSKRACHVCSKRRTVFTCKDCNIPLCVVPCFEKYHSQLNYK